MHHLLADRERQRVGRVEVLDVVEDDDLPTERDHVKGRPLRGPVHEWRDHQQRDGALGLGRRLGKLLVGLQRFW